MSEILTKERVEYLKGCTQYYDTNMWTEMCASHELLRAAARKGGGGKAANANGVRKSCEE